MFYKQHCYEIFWRVVKWFLFFRRLNKCVHLFPRKWKPRQSHTYFSPLFFFYVYISSCLLPPLKVSRTQKPINVCMSVRGCLLGVEVENSIIYTFYFFIFFFISFRLLVILTIFSLLLIKRWKILQLVYIQQ